MDFGLFTLLAATVIKQTHTWQTYTHTHTLAQNNLIHNSIMKIIIIIIKFNIYLYHREFTEPIVRRFIDIAARVRVCMRALIRVFIHNIDVKYHVELNVIIITISVRFIHKQANIHSRSRHIGSRALRAHKNYQFWVWILNLNPSPPLSFCLFPLSFTSSSSHFSLSVSVSFMLYL